MPLKMTLDDKEFTLSNEALVAMATTLWRTRVKERGLMFCQDTEITPGREYIGGKYSVRGHNCAGKPRVGDFHTHPTGTADLSWWDAYAILSASYWHEKPWLGCRGSKVPIPSGEIQCQTAKKIPILPELQHFAKKRARMRFTAARDDPEIRQYITSEHSFPARKVPEIIKPPVPVPVAPRIKTEELVFAESRFMKYTDLDTGETRIEQVY